jgi:hypothetical protein
VVMLGSMSLLGSRMCEALTAAGLDAAGNALLCSHGGGRVSKFSQRKPAIYKSHASCPAPNRIIS